MVSDKQILFLRKRCHNLKAIVTVGGAGLTENVMNEINLALGHHELIKVKISTADRDARNSITDSILESSHATLIQTIGHTASFYRAADQAVIVLPES